jgi:hypothetical protein
VRDTEESAWNPLLGLIACGFGVVPFVLWINWSSPNDPPRWVGIAGASLAALVFGILGLLSGGRRPTAVGRGFAIVGIVVGLLTGLGFLGWFLWGLAHLSMAH